jgi:hypothetical protein
VTHLSEHTTVLKIKSLALLFEMDGFEENVKLSFFSNTVCFGKDTIERCVSVNDKK